jgi:hypothetical protein
MRHHLVFVFNGLVRQRFKLGLSIIFGKTIRFLALSDKSEHAGASHQREHFLFFHMVVAEGQCAPRLQYSVKLLQDVIGTSKIVKDIIQQDSIQTIVWEPSAAIRLDGPDVPNPFSCRLLFDLLNGKWMYVERMNFTGRTHQFYEWHDVAARSAAEIEYGESGFYSGFFQHIQTRSKEVTDLEHETHELEAHIRHWSIRCYHFPHPFVLFLCCRTPQFNQPPQGISHAKALNAKPRQFTRSG